VELIGKVFWTGLKKSGCAGQYSDCFSDGNDGDVRFEGTILPSDNGGSCVGFAMSGDEFIAKSMPCDRKFTLGCQSQGTRKQFIEPIKGIVILFVIFDSSLDHFAAAFFYSDHSHF
jgi:hypothetical protein